MKILIEEFKFLTSEFGMQIIDSYLKGSFPYVVWSNNKKNIKVVFDFTDNKPVHIFVYDSNDLAMYNYKEFVNELVYAANSKKEIVGYIKHAAKVFYELLKNSNLI